MAKEGDLKIYWIPQVPMQAFEMPVQSIDEAALLLWTLGAYDLFQLEHNVKPDFCNAGGLVIYKDGDWEDWYNEGEHPEYCMDSEIETIDDVIELHRANGRFNLVGLRVKE